MTNTEILRCHTIPCKVHLGK